MPTFGMLRRILIVLAIVALSLVSIWTAFRDYESLTASPQNAAQQMAEGQRALNESDSHAQAEAQIIDGKIQGPERPVGFRAYLPSESRAADWPVIFMLPARHMSVERAYAHLGHRLAAHDYVVIVVDYQEPLNIVAAPVEELRETLRGQDHSESPEIIQQLRVDTLALFNSREQIREQLPQGFQRLDLNRIGLMGHLSGGLQAQLLLGARLDSGLPQLNHAAFHQQPQGLQIQAAVIYSPYGRDHVRIPFSLTEPPWALIQTPLLLVNGDRDLHFSKRLMAHPTNNSMFLELPGKAPAYSLNLIDGTTADFMGRKGRDRPNGDGQTAIAALTRIFFDAYIRRSERDLNWLKSLDVSPTSETEAFWAPGRRVRDFFNRIDSKATPSTNHSH